MESNGENIKCFQSTAAFSKNMVMKHCISVLPRTCFKEKKVEPGEPWLPPCSLRRMISVSEPKLFQAVQL